MTDYCTTADIEGWFPGVDFNAGTKIKKTKVEDIISRKSAYIDSRLNDRYETPITGTNALLLVKEICEYLVVADVEPILKSGLGRRGEQQKPIDYREIAENRLKNLESGISELSDASSRSSADFASYNYDNDVDFEFDRDKVQW